MRFSSAALCLLGACAVSLDDAEPDAPPADGGVALPLATGCRPFTTLTGLAALDGALHSIAEPDGTTLWVADDAHVGSADVSSLAIVVPATASVDDCLAAAQLEGGAPMSALPSGADHGLAGILVSGVPWLFYTELSGFTTTGFGVAPQGATPALFTPGEHLLWTGDRPSYGTAAVASGPDVYVYGCLSARFLDADCYVARVPSGSMADESAYAYYTGGGAWSPRVDDAWPLASAGAVMDVAWMPLLDRWLMVFVEPLGDTIRVRSGLRPEGPWSAPIDLARCDLPDADMFCAGLALHPALTKTANALYLSYAPSSLASDAAARRSAEPQKWWPRLAGVPLPSLP